MTRRPLASIDAGSNTLRLLIGHVEGGRITERLECRREATRLARGIHSSGALKAEVIARSVDVLCEYRDLCLGAGVRGILAVGTSALREARNSAEFISMLRARCDLQVRIIDGDEEARMTALGVMGAIRPPHEQVVIVDIGGGSTEFTLVCEGGVVRGFSLPWGVVKLSEAHLGHDPAMSDELTSLGNRADALAREALGRLRQEGLRGREFGLVLTAGTPTTLAAMDMGLVEYDRSRVEGHALGLGRMLAIMHRLAPLDRRGRMSIQGLDPGREDLIMAGLMLTISIMQTMGRTEAVVSDSGLLEGALITLCKEIEPSA